jgi:hypothetical protein
MAALTYQMVARGFSKEDANELVENQLKKNA